MKLCNYRLSDYRQLKQLLIRCDLFDKSYDTKKKLDSKKPRGSIIIAEEKAIIGCVFFTWDNWDSSIYRLAVHPKHRNKGIGIDLLEEAERRLKKKGADVSSLSVHVKNKAAIKFFRKRRYKGRWGPYWDLEKKL